MARVKLEGVRKIYENGFVAVHGVDFDVDDGEFVVLVGPSGCGKSTILRMIAGLESISAGQLTIGERVVNSVPPKERDIAMVFQDYALYPHMSVYENMAFALRLRKRPDSEIAERVQRAAGILGAEAILDRRPGQLSGGQRQRVAIGRAIVREPQVFLFDEPLSNLDAKLRVQMRHEIAKLHRQLRATMVYVTHDQVEAMTLADRIVVLSEGRVQQIDTPLGLYDRPRNTFVAAFIGSPAMNLLPGELSRDGMEVRAMDGALGLPLGDTRRERLRAYAGRAVVVGVRPEHIGVANGADALPRARLRLDVVEPMGNEILLHACAGALDVTARIAPQALPSPGQPIDLTFDAARVHYFDADTGEVIVDEAAPAGGQADAPSRRRYSPSQ